MKVFVWLLHLKMASNLVESWNGIQVIHWENLSHVLWLHSFLQVLLSIKGGGLDEAITIV